jgi:hypothetical protein
VRACYAFVFCLGLVAVSACSGNSSPSEPGGNSLKMTSPLPESPLDAAQLSTLRPTLVVKNGTSDQPGTRTYEFQISDRSDFSAAAATLAAYTVIAQKPSIPEGAGGTTSYTPDVDLQPTTRLYWRARMTQGTTSSEWSATRSFNTLIAGYSRPGELYDPLVNETTIGTTVGSTTFIAGKGLRINDERSYVRYPLAQPIINGEMSVEVEGLSPNAPGAKLKIFSMMDGTGDLLKSKYLLHVQYRGGVDGNPNNAIAFKALFGDEDLKFETDLGQRSAGVRLLDPSRTYFWKATWSSEFRLVIQEGRAGAEIYNLGISSRGATYAPHPHYAYLGTNNRWYSNDETGSWPGAIYRNLWIGNAPRPQSLGSALDAPQPY